ncbi:HGGxSTG domain-containing protein [Noviluteimonas lactosilytica]|uniref:HGGxSTG domain-containing protein n=1 Tax=Noviluteimonas lactosilytica TaxID=2888523 RepID=UPI003CCDCC44
MTRAINFGGDDVEPESHRVKVPCGGRRRCDGLPCEAPSIPGKRRCKWHGGCSTGPRTSKGKAKVAFNLPRIRAARNR